jgi:hypothetical protein
MMQVWDRGRRADAEWLPRLLYPILAVPVTLSPGILQVGGAAVPTPSTRNAWERLR